MYISLLFLWWRTKKNMLCLPKNLFILEITFHGFCIHAAHIDWDGHYIIINHFFPYPGMYLWVPTLMSVIHLRFRVCVDRHDLSWYVFMSAYMNVCHAFMLHFRTCLERHDEEQHITWENLFILHFIGMQQQKGCCQYIANYIAYTTNDYKKIEST
jgi:hypothetical protein